MEYICRLLFDPWLVSVLDQVIDNVDTVTSLDIVSFFEWLCAASYHEIFPEYSRDNLRLFLLKFAHIDVLKNLNKLLELLRNLLSNQGHLDPFCVECSVLSSLLDLKFIVESFLFDDRPFDHVEDVSFTVFFIFTLFHVESGLGQLFPVLLKEGLPRNIIIEPVLDCFNVDLFKCFGHYF